MPIYEYRCKSCGVVREVIQKISDRPLKKCPKCSGALEKLISRSSFQLKGTGWYESDYGRKSKPSDSKDSSSGDTSSSSEKSAKEKTASGEKASTDKVASGEKGSTERVASSSGSPRKKSS